MAISFTGARDWLRDIRFQRPLGAVVETPNGKEHAVIGAALHSETLECLLVIRNCETGAWSAVAPAAVKPTGDDEDLAPEDIRFDDLSSVRHRKGGVYTRLRRLTSKDGEMVLYVAHADGIWWLRPSAMFEDGRFESSSEAVLGAGEIFG